MTILVTGVAGFIGSTTARALLARGETVIGIDNLNDYYDVTLKHARLARLQDEGGDRFTFEAIDFAEIDDLTARARQIEEALNATVDQARRAGLSLVPQAS